MPIKQMSLAQIKDFIKPPAPRGIEEVVLHHTWSPTIAQYRGQATWEGIRNYHVNENGWSDIGYHFGVGGESRERLLWKLRPVTKSGAHVLNRNQHTIGVGMIGNFDVEDPTLSVHAAAGLVRLLVDRFKLAAHNIRFHREFENKSCPGIRVSLAAFRELVMGTPQATWPIRGRRSRRWPWCWAARSLTVARSSSTAGWRCYWRH